MCISSVGVPVLLLLETTAMGAVFPELEPTMTTLPVFYRPEQAIPSTVRLPSPSAAKPQYVVESWQRLRIPLELRSFAPLTVGQLARAHDRRYVERVLSLREPNGFGTRDPEVAAALPFTNGSFVAAALHAFETGGVAISPVSGFHHACFGDGGAYCTFNGLAIAAAMLVDAGAEKVGILDCDAHYGNGTVDILARLPTLGAKVLHYTRGSGHYTHGSSAKAFLDELPALLARWKADGCEVLLYQAGADPHVEDPLGGYYTTAQLLERDRRVFTACRELGLPVAWDLAGGYQERPGQPWPERIRPVLDLHDNTLRACAEVYLSS